MSFRIKGVIYVCYGAVQKNVPDALVKMMENGLGFTQGISNNNGVKAFVGILPPPVVYAGIDFLGWGEFVYRKAKGRFGDKMVAFDRLEGHAQAVVHQLVIPGDHPDFTLVFQANLCGADNMSCRMKANSHPIA